MAKKDDKDTEQAQIKSAQADAQERTDGDKGSAPGEPAPTQNQPSQSAFPLRGQYRLLPGKKHSVIRKVESGEVDGDGKPITINEVSAVKPGDVIELSRHQAHAFRDKFELVKE